MDNKPMCPTCGQSGRSVKRLTLEHLLVPERRADIDPSPYFVCTTGQCEVVYFSPTGGPTFRKTDLTVRFGLKESDSPRPVCYCFDHTVEQIEEEIRRTGVSTVVDSIKADMKGPGCRCEFTNPLGGCCLKTVQTAVADAFQSIGNAEHAAATESAEYDDCCAKNEPLTEDQPMKNDCCATHDEIVPPTDASTIGGGQPSNAAMPVASGSDRAGLFTTSGSIVAAILSSACCWLPLLLIGFGASAAGVAGFFEAYRPYFVVAALALLAVGFYTVYFRQKQCAPGSACATPNRNLRLFSKTMLWTATTLVAAFVFFPNYIGYVIGAPIANTADTAHLAFDEYHIEGMTCEGCATTLSNALAKLPNAVAIEVDYAKKSAVIRYRPDHPVPADRVTETVKAAGYHAALTAAHSQPASPPHSGVDTPQHENQK